MKLFNFERRWLENIMDTVIPTGGDDRYPLGALDTDAVEIFEQMLLHLPAVTGLGLRASIAFVELLGPMASIKKPARFSRLDPPGREACLHGMTKSSVYLVRQMVLLHKMNACFGWGGDARVHEAIGLNQPPSFVKRETRP